MDPRFEHFSVELEKLSIQLNEEQYQQFMDYYEMLIETNKVMNLTSITEFDQVIEKHFLDSLNLIRAVELNGNINLMDMGTGAGFPGIPLKIAFPELNVTLADSLNKRVIFLQKVIDRLKLQNIQAVHGRAEDLAKSPLYREKYDLVVSRAVANLSTLTEYCLPFVKLGGSFISYKSGDCQDEIKKAGRAVSIIGGKIKKIENFELGEAGRSFVVISKIKNTPKGYPRKAGMPSKNPL